MRSLTDTLTRLSAFRNRPGFDAAGMDRLADLPPFGSNPGALRGRFYLPACHAASSPLVVVLHGCVQDAAGYDRGSGWSQLADEQGFALLYPEQQRGNNANLCFNWFNPADTRRSAGEALSIRQMIAAMIADHAIDPDRVYVTGLSAGGAMTSAMLATYPDVFAGGAIIAGLPYGTAATMAEAFDRMRAHGGPPADSLGALVQAASPHQGPWPTISVWHGDGDATVSHANAALIVEQWRAIHQADCEPAVVETVNGHCRQAWCDAQGREVIEAYRIAGLAHGTPLSTAGPEACGAAAPYMLEAGISSTRRIADFWGLAGNEDRLRDTCVGETPPVATRPRSTLDSVSYEGGSGDAPGKSMAGGVGRVIEDALRAAGLMR